MQRIFWQGKLGNLMLLPLEEAGAKEVAAADYDRKVGMYGWALGVADSGTALSGERHCLTFPKNLHAHSAPCSSSRLWNLTLASRHAQVSRVSCNPYARRPVHEEQALPGYCSQPVLPMPSEGLHFLCTMWPLALTCRCGLKVSGRDKWSLGSREG